MNINNPVKTIDNWRLTIKSSNITIHCNTCSGNFSCIHIRALLDEGTCTRCLNIISNNLKVILASLLPKYQDMINYIEIEGIELRNSLKSNEYRRQIRAMELKLKYEMIPYWPPRKPDYE